MLVYVFNIFKIRKNHPKTFIIYKFNLREDNYTTIYVLRIRYYIFGILYINFNNIIPFICLLLFENFQKQWRYIYY